MISADPRSQRKIAECIGVSNTAIQYWLKGSRPDWDNCNAIARCFGITDGLVHRLNGYTDYSSFDATAGVILSPRIR